MAGRRNEYVYGNTARALRPIEKEIRSPGRTGAKSHRKINKESGMNPGYMIFMTLAMVLTGIVCVQYIRMQSSLTTYVNTISAMEIELQSLRAENDDYEKRINGAIGLENIKKRAMDELGMTYASDDQIVVYNSDGTDYVRQFVSLE